MNSRERILAIVVGALAVVVGGYFFYSWMASALQLRRSQIVNLQKKLVDQKRLVAQTEAAKAKIVAAQKRSLPPQKELARTLYQDWLFDRVHDAGIADPKVAYTTQVVERDLYTAFNFTITGKGTLSQVVALLYDIHSVDFFHRISRLSLRPIKDTKQLAISITLDAVSMLDAPQASQLVPRPAKRLALSSREEYVKAIGERNLFGPANRAPSLSGLGRTTAETGREVEVTAQATDPDVLDKSFKFRMEKSAAEDARLDPASGRFRWTPRRRGTYEFDISVTDDGLPAKTTIERLVVTVSDPQAPPPVTRTLAFDEAKYTVLAGIVAKNGASEVWLLVRPRSENQMLKLGVGEKFEIGSVKGVVKSIGVEDFTFESDGKLKKLTTSGEVLVNALASPQ
ncbi:MAG TPA: hypothetical protein VFB96_11410 [Pirellulaceae bacterium]|nr:hypothetical protein [Pirellulaceae bacterium]